MCPTIIYPLKTYERGCDAFLERLRIQFNEGKTNGIREAAGRLLHYYEEDSDRLDSEVRAQLSINRSDLLGRATPSLEQSVIVPVSPKKRKRTRIGPVEQRVLELIGEEEELHNQKRQVDKIAGKSS